MTGVSIRAVEVFYSYAPEDERWQKELEKQLSGLKRKGLIVDWHKRKILAGQERAYEIDTHLNSAAVILLLVSPDFIASDYCYDIEVMRALERHNAGLACVIPIILRPTDWRGTPFDHLQMLPDNARPITKWANRDDAFLNVVLGIREVIEMLSLQKPVDAARSHEGISDTWHDLFEHFHNDDDAIRSHEDTAGETDATREASFHYGSSISKSHYYDITLSYASEDHAYAEALASLLRMHKVKIFYDQYEKEALKDQNLYTYLADLYQNQASYSVVFLSENYASTLWTSHEREAAQVRALRENNTRIIYVRLDKVEIPGLSPTAAYLDWPPETARTVAETILEKLRDQKTS